MRTRSWRILIAALSLTASVNFAQAKQLHHEPIKAHDYHLGMELRSDLNYFSHTTTPALNNGENSPMVFRVNHGMLNFHGHVNNSTAYAFRWNLNDALSQQPEPTYNTGTDSIVTAPVKTYAATGTPDRPTADFVQKMSTGILGGINELYVQHNFFEFFGVRFGKMLTHIGGREGDYNKQDVYRYSVAARPLHARVGAALEFKRMDNMLTVGLWNNFYDSDARSRFHTGSVDEFLIFPNQSMPMLGFIWHGNFLKKMISPIVSYHYSKKPDVKDVDGNIPGNFKTNLASSADPLSAVNGNSISANYLALGSRFSFLDDMFFVEFDYLRDWTSQKDVDGTLSQGALNAAKATTIGGKMEQNDQSIIFLAKYNKGPLRPLAKLELSTMTRWGQDIDATQTGTGKALKYTSGKSHTVTAFTGAVEYFFHSNEKVRAHIYYVYLNDKDNRQPNTAFNKVTTGEFGLGMGMEI